MATPPVKSSRSNEFYFDANGGYNCNISYNKKHTTIIFNTEEVKAISQ